MKTIFILSAALILSVPAFAQKVHTEADYNKLYKKCLKYNEIGSNYCNRIDELYDQLKASTVKIILSAPDVPDDDEDVNDPIADACSDVDTVVRRVCFGPKN